MKRAGHPGADRGSERPRRIFKLSLRDRLTSLWNGPMLSPDDMEAQAEVVRELMLKRLGAGGTPSPSLLRRITYAGNVQTLWYLRSELMAALAFAHDETRARREMAEITAAFQGALPKGLQAPVRTFRH